MQLMLTNSYDHPSDRLNVLLSLNLLNVSDPQSQLMIANTFDTVFDVPRLTVASGVRCLSDWHCFEQGKCLMGRCSCDTGYVGEYCQMKPNEVEIAANLTKAVLTRVPEYFKDHKL